MKSAALSTLAAEVGVGEDMPFDYGDIFPKANPSERRRAGVLLHPTSFRGPHGIGDLGEEAFRFIDWLHEAGCSLWQVLPLVPPGRKANEEGSPYAGQDANCGNTLLISLEEIVKDGLLTKEELPKPVLQRGLLGVKVNLKVSLKLSVLTLIYQAGLRMQLILQQLTAVSLLSVGTSGLNLLKNRHLAALEEIYQSKQHFVRSG